MSESGDGFERTKLKKQLTQRMRKNKDGKGAGGPKAITAAEETKSTASKASSKKSSFVMPAVVKKYAPTYLTQRPSYKVVFDVAFFSAAAFIIYKFGKQMNDSISAFVPTEASLRQ